MKVFLLRVNDERAIFYGENREEERPLFDESAETSGVRALLSRKYADMQRLLRESESGIGLHMRRVWEWLHRRTAPDEPLLRSLRGAEDAPIELLHPADLSGAQAAELWTEYLHRRRRRSTLWLIVNLLITPITLLLAPFPGPNIIGYWFTYRAICHALALLGIRRANDVGVNSQATSALNFYLDDTDEERLASLSQTYELKELNSFVARMMRKRRAPHDEKLAVS